MNPDTGPLLVISTCSDAAQARLIAHRVVESGLAACVNLVDGVRSIYRWQGELHEDGEVLLIMKTSAARYDELEQAIIDVHPYELPEVIAVPIERGFEHYLAWIDEHTAS